MSAILSFLGGSAFRAIWASTQQWLEKRQDHKHEIQRMQLQGSLDAAQHARNLDSLRLQAELGVKTIEVQSDADQARIGAEAFREAVKLAQTPTGIKWVDAWNACVRPAFATVVLILWLASLKVRGWALTPWDLELSASIAGFYFADRSLGKRGK
jgi:hypothetical protein